MTDEENNHDDFRLDPLVLESVKHLLSQGKNYSEIADALDINRHTVSKVDKQMVKQAGVAGDDKQEQKRVSVEEYKNLLNRIRKLEALSKAYAVDDNRLFDRCDNFSANITGLFDMVAKNEEEIAILRPLPSMVNQIIGMGKDISLKLRALTELEDEHWNYTHKMFLNEIKPQMSVYDEDLRKNLDEYLNRKWGKVLSWEE